MSGGQTNVSVYWSNALYRNIINQPDSSQTDSRFSLRLQFTASLFKSVQKSCSDLFKAVNKGPSTERFHVSFNASLAESISEMY